MKLVRLRPPGGRNRKVAVFLSVVLALGVAGTAVAQVHAPGPGPISAHPIPVPVHTIAPPVVARPIPTPAGDGVSPMLRGIGRHPKLGRLPPLPRRTAANTYYRNKMRPFAANGDEIQITTGSGCGSNVGQTYAVGCAITWKFQAGAGATPPGTDHLEDCYAPDNQPSTTANCGTSYTGGDAGQSTTLSASGVWVFGILDTTTAKWLTVAYLPVGSGVYMDTFSDTFYTTEATQFTAASGNTAYIEVTGLTGGTEKYEVYIEYTSVSPNCVYEAPAESPAPAAGSLCNPANDTGQTAPSGTLQVPWPLSASYLPGTYSIVIYDITAGMRLAQRQVSLTSGSASISLTPTGGMTSPNPVPAGTPGSVFAFDTTSEQSDKTLALSATGLTHNVNFTGVISDPTGQVVQSFSQGSGSSGTFSQNWNFTNSQSPADYPLNTYTFTLLNQTSQAVEASKGFKIAGYQMLTEFTSPVGTSIQVSSTPATTGIQFTNYGNTAYGTSNGDPLQGIVFDMGSQSIIITLLNGTSSTTGVCAGAVSCQTETLSDSAGISWSLYNYCSGSGSHEDCTIYATPVTPGQSLAAGASLTVANVQYVDSFGGNHCQNGCEATTSVLPLDGITWSSTSAGVASNPVFFNNGNHTTYTGTSNMNLYGYRDAGNTLHTNKEAHGYSIREITAGVGSTTYTSTSPSSSGTAKLVYAINMVNNSSGGSNPITQWSVLMPTGFTVSSASVDAASPTSWVTQTCSGGTPAQTICFNHSGGNTGVQPGGGTETMYMDISPPTTSIAYTDAAINSINPSVFGLSADGTYQVYVGTTPAPENVDTTALTAYSLNSALMTTSTSPTAIGTGTNQSVSFTVSNVATGADNNPDYLDAIIVSVPTANTLSSISVSTTGWSELGTTVSGANTYYWFGLCASQENALYVPPNDGMPACTTATEEADALGPGGTLSFTANVLAGASAGTIAMTMYAHGANGNGWSSGKSFTETVSATSVDVGFSADGPVSGTTAISTGTLPTIGADSDSTLGNAFVYTISNTSSTGAAHNITTITITVPGKDVSGNNGADSSNTPWTITAAPTLTGSGFSNCSVTSYTSATAAGANGSIVIGGASCALTPNGVMNVNFDAKAPYKVNDTYQFPATANGGAATVSETWTNDTEMEIILSASLSITVNPATNASAGTTPSVNCPSCTFASGSVDMGTISNPGAVTGTDVAEVDVTTNAASPIGWKLYVDTSANPSNTAGTYLNELVTDVDNGASISGAGVTYDSTSLTVVPTISPGTQLLDTGSGTSVRRNPFGFVMNYEVYINGGVTTSQSPTITYTFISS